MVCNELEDQDEGLVHHDIDSRVKMGIPCKCRLYQVVPIGEGGKVRDELSDLGDLVQGNKHA